MVSGIFWAWGYNYIKQRIYPYIQKHIFPNQRNMSMKSLFIFFSKEPSCLLYCTLHVNNGTDLTSV